MRIYNDPVKRSQAVTNGEREALNTFVNAPLKAARASADTKSMIAIIGRDKLNPVSLSIKPPRELYNYSVKNAIAAEF